MSKKLGRYLEDIEKTEKKMAELKAHLEAVRQSQKRMKMRRLSAASTV